MAKGWSQRFADPIKLDGTTLRTLRDAIAYLGKTVPKSERDHPAVVLASTVLTGAAEGRNLVMLARSATYRALTRNHPPPAFKPSSGKDPHWGKRKLKRDQ